MFAVCLKHDSKSIFFATTTTIHIFGLIKVTATITPVDSESNNYVYDKVETPGSSTQALQLLKLGKSTDKNYENIILTIKLWIVIAVLKTCQLNSFSKFVFVLCNV